MGKGKESRPEKIKRAYEACPKDKDGSVSYENLQAMIQLMDEVSAWKTERRTV